MQLRPSQEADLPAILNIIGQAQHYFKQNGIDQWQNGYPNEERIQADLLQATSYVMTLDQVVVATAMISFDGEPTYQDIDGQWISNTPYAVVHRLAVDNQYKGKNIAGIIMKHVETLCLERGYSSIRIDTHEKNTAMQQVILKCAFKYCGIIQVSDGTLRKAYEKCLTKT